MTGPTREGETVAAARAPTAADAPGGADVMVGADLPIAPVAPIAPVPPVATVLATGSVPANTAVAEAGALASTNVDPPAAAATPTSTIPGSGRVQGGRATDAAALGDTSNGDGEQASRKGGRVPRKRKPRILGLTPRRFLASVVLPIVCVVIIVITLVLAPADDRSLLFFASLVAVASGLAATSIGVYGGVLVPGLLLLGVDPRFAAAASLFLQVLVIPLGAGAHYRLGNISRKVALPLIVGGMAGAFTGPFFAAALPADVIARLVAAMIVGVGVIVLATLRWTGLGTPRAPDDVPTGRVAGVGLAAGFSSGISGAGWGPIGVKLLILLRIEPKAAIGSSLVGRTFMAAAAVIAYMISATALEDVSIDWWMLVLLFAGSVAAMVPGAFVVSRLGREGATIVITLLSISLALPTLIWGTH